MDTTMLLTILLVHLAALRSTVEPSELTDIWSEETTGHWGEWGAKDICTDKKPIYGYRMKSEKHQGGSDDTGLTGVQLYCQGGGSVTSTVSKWGDWLAASWCPGVDNPVVGFRIMIEPKRGFFGDDTAANRVELVCQHGEILKGETYTRWGEWSPIHKCPPGKVVVGIQTRVEKSRGGHRDDSAMNGLRLLCHELSDVDECAKENGGCSHTCVNTKGGHHCQCPSGFMFGIDHKSCADTNECAVRNGGCSHTCVNTDGGYLCQCPDGFILGEDKKTCSDVNECAKENGGCSHTCVNTDGGYHCQCPNGFSLAKDKKTCDDNHGGCSHKFKKIGCFRKNEQLFKTLMITDLDPYHHNWGQKIDFDNFQKSLNSLACRCRAKALGKFKYFSLGFYGECWGANAEDFRSLHLPDNVGVCINEEMDDCHKTSNMCTGIYDNEYIYRIIPDPVPTQPPPKGPCHIKQNMAHTLNKSGVEKVRVPTCEANGDYTMKQCATYGRRRCWCIKGPKTPIRIPSTEMGFPHYYKLECLKNGTDDSHKKYDMPCEDYLVKVSYLVSKGAPNMWIPACDEDGHFQSKQCKGQKECWCVNTKDGKKIPGSTKQMPELLNMKCSEDEEEKETKPSDFPYRNYKDKQCKKRTWKREGCYNTKEHLVRGPLLVYWRFDIEWEKDRIHKFAHSLVCACAEAAKSNGFQYFGTHFWGECWGLETDQMVYTTRGDCTLTDGLYQTTCNENHFRNSVNECLGIKSYSVYSLRK